MIPILLSMSSFVFCILLFFLREIVIVGLLRSLLESDYTSFYGGGGGREGTVAA